MIFLHASAVAICSAISLHLCLRMQSMHSSTPAFSSVGLFNLYILLDIFLQNNYRLAGVVPMILSLSSLVFFIRHLRCWGRDMGVEDALCCVLLCFVVARSTEVLWAEMRSLILHKYVHAAFFGH